MVECKALFLKSLGGAVFRHGGDCDGIADGQDRLNVKGSEGPVNPFGMQTAHLNVEGRRERRIGRVQVQRTKGGALSPPGESWKHYNTNSTGI